MKTSFSLGKILGISIQVHFTFLIILALFSWFFATAHITIWKFNLGFGNEAIPFLGKIGLGVLVSLLFFLCVLLHEIAHSYIAIRMGQKVRGITLFIFGGISQLDDIPHEPPLELKITLAGPLISIGLAAVFFFLFFVPTTIDAISSFNLFSIAMGTLSFYNLLIGVFNLIPAFPLDGGRVVRALLATRMEYGRATKTAATIGKIIAVFMAIIGIFINIWLTLVAIFIYMGASQEEKTVEMSLALEGLTVKDIMSTPVVTVPPDMPLDDLSDYMMIHKHMGYPVTENSKLVGIVTVTDLHGHKKNSVSTQIKDIMTTPVITISSDNNAIDAFKIMAKNNVGRLVVTKNNQVQGIITRSDLFHAVKLKDL
jgi:Zn-dependent protease